MKSKIIAALPILFISGIIFGSNLVVSRFSLGQFQPLAYISFRFLIASVCYFLLFVFVKDHKFPSDPKIILHGCIYGIIGTTIPLSCSVYSMKYLSSGVTSLLITMNPVLTVLFAHYMLQDEPLTRYKFFGAIIALGGASLLILQGENGLPEINSTNWIGYIWIIPVVLGLAYASVYARKYLSKINSIDGAAIRIFISAISITPLALLTNSYNFEKVQLNGILVLLYVSIIGTFLAFFLNFYIVKKYGATVVSITTYISPISAAALGAIFLNEEITLLIVVGMMIIFCGIAIMGFSPKKSIGAFEI